VVEHAVGSIVSARGRDWVVLPGSTEDFLLLRPLGGAEDEVAGIHAGLEEVKQASFGLPDAKLLGDHHSCSLLRSAFRLSARAAAGPFRCFARIAVEPRPYQLVPLLMALKRDPVRILVADDVGVGKTVEACLIAREMLDRGEAKRLAVLTPPHLAEQWQRELKRMFHIDAELVLSGTAARLERHCDYNQSLFDIHPFVVVSLDFIKSDRRRDDFIRACPELVIVDEAHTCAFGGAQRGGRHQRYQLIKTLAADPNRHVILVTATPHSEDEQAFRSLLTLLDPALENLPNDLSGEHNRKHRELLAEYFVQRRRADIRAYLDENTMFPVREEGDETYRLSPEYKALLDKVVSYARETVQKTGESGHRLRVRWWSALALLRSLGSSPAAAAATLRNRADVADTENEAEADEIGRKSILDLEAEENAERLDFNPGADLGEFADDEQRNRRRLRALANEAEALSGAKDAKLQKGIELVKTMLRDGFNPIVFCRFIDTAEYVAAALAKALPKGVAVEAVTGRLAPEERESRIEELGKQPRRVMVATDCLSEGVNLQDHFDAVMHYDLSWNPTRHEQREGRVDRFGQKRPKVRALMYYGLDNPIDGIVLDVLLRKHKTIKTAIGIAVPVPVDTNQVIEAIFEGLLLKQKDNGQLSFDFIKPQKETLHTQWDNVTEKEKKSRTVFAQETIKVEEVAGELAAMRQAVGSAREVAKFTRDVLQATGAAVQVKGELLHADLADVSQVVKDICLGGKELTAAFDLPVDDDVEYLARTHPVVEGLANYLIDTALDPPEGKSLARRTGVIRTKSVSIKTTLLLLRCRYQLTTTVAGRSEVALVEDCQLVGFKGAADKPEWLDQDAVLKLIEVGPDENTNEDQARIAIEKALAGCPGMLPALNEHARQNGERILDAHRRVRRASKARRIDYAIEAKLPVDILGVYVYFPVVKV